jgi:hypothetical protein
MVITTPKTTMAPDMSKAWIYRTAPSYSYHRTLPQDDTRTIVDKSVSEEIIRYPCDLCDQSTLRPTAVGAGITKTNTTAAPSASIDFQTDELVSEENIRNACYLCGRSELVFKEIQTSMCDLCDRLKRTLRPTAAVTGITKTKTTTAPGASIDFQTTAEVYRDDDFSFTTPEPFLFRSATIVQQDTTIETTVESKYLEQTFTESTESTESTKSTATVVIEIIAFEENNPDETESTKTIFEKAFDVISYPIELVGSFFRNLFGY